MHAVHSQKENPAVLVGKMASARPSFTARYIAFHHSKSCSGRFQTNEMVYDARLKTTVMLDGRLTNAPELRQRFKLDEASDAALIAHAYEQWGRDCPSHLMGEYAIVIWDESLQTLFCFLDHLGLRKLYYYYDGHTFACSSRPDALHALPFLSRRPGLERIAAQNDIDYLLSHPELSFFEQISQLPSATLLTLRPGYLNLCEYWQPNFEARLNFKSEAEYTEAFQDLFSAVIREKLRGTRQVVSMLSGGLDSSAITAQAAHILGEEGRSLTALSALLAPEYQTGNTDERAFIERLQMPNLHVQPVIDAWRGPFDGLDKYESLGQSSRYYLYRAFANTASQCGADLILDGCFGELGPSCYAKGYFAEVFLRGDWRLLWRESRQLAARYQLDWCRLLMGQIIFPLLPARLQTYWYSRRERVRHVGFLNAEFTRQHLAKPCSFQLARVHPNHHRNQAKMMHCRRSQDSWVPDDLGRPVYFSYPYADPRLLEFCLALPGTFKIKDGYKRYALRAGMKGVLPDALRFRTCKQPFSPDYHERYNRDLPKARQFLADLPKNELMREVIDIAALTKALHTPMQTNRCATRIDYQAMHTIPVALNTLAFLSSF